MDKKNYICIACPVGCHLEVETDGKKITNIKGNKCKRGIDYALDEFTDPKRTVTVTCSVDSELINRIPVKTSEPISKKYINDLIKELYEITLKPPLKVGDTIIENYKDTGVNIVVSRNLHR
jgi:CxxC motif-containing protein